MELILANKHFVDEKRIFNAAIDVQLGDTNDFEIKIKRGDYDSEYKCGNIIYAPQTEYGGVIGEINTQTSLDIITCKGFVWRGILDKKIIKPPEGQSHKTVSGEINSILKSLINEAGLSGVFSVSDENTGKVIEEYKIDRYTTLLSGIQKMLKSVGYKLTIKYMQQERGLPGLVKLSATPIIDFSSRIELSEDYQLDFKFKDVKNGVNHLICLGKGENENRVVIDLYIQRDGSVGAVQEYEGIEEVAQIFEDANSEADDLRVRGIEKLLELANHTEFEMDVATLNLDVDIGDIVGGRDYITGLYAKKPIKEKTWRFENGKESIEYIPEGNDVDSEGGIEYE